MSGKLKQFMEGKKTHVANIVRSAVVLLVTLGVVNVDPEVAVVWVQQSWEWILAGEALFLVAVSFFRSLGRNREKKLEQQVSKK